MTANGWLQIGFFLMVIFLVTKPLGVFMTRVFNQEKTFLDPLLRPIEKLVYRLTAVDEKREMCRTEYAVAMLLFSGVSAAEFQIPRVARERTMKEDDVRTLVQKHTKDRDLGFLGEPRVKCPGTESRSRFRPSLAMNFTACSVAVFPTQPLEVGTGIQAKAPSRYSAVVLGPSRSSCAAGLSPREGSPSPHRGPVPRQSAAAFRA